jgi:hypothetical protein
MIFARAHFETLTQSLDNEAEGVWQNVYLLARKYPSFSDSQKLKEYFQEEQNIPQT